MHLQPTLTVLIMSPADGTSVSSPSTPALLGMTQGDGEDSYAQNSSAQGELMAAILPIFFEAIKSMTFPNPDEVFRIVDIGCASGPNTITNVEAIIEQVRLRYRTKLGVANNLPEVQVFFQDLPTNDFNTLFKNLEFSQPTTDSVVEQAKNYTCAAVPSSFTHRALPRSTINFALSTFTLHWLTKVPDAVLDRQNPAYNGGHTNIHCSTLATLQAYAEQAEKDLDDFFAAMAHEVVSGGLICLTFIVRPKFHPYIAEPVFTAEEEVWNALVLEGSVSEELRDSFNLPYYPRTMEEVKKQLEKYSSVFEVQNQATFTSGVALKYYPVLNGSSDLRAGARALVMFSRGMLATSYEAHFGKAKTNFFYQRQEQALHELLSRWREGAEKPAVYGTFILNLILRRK